MKPENQAIASTAKATVGTTLGSKLMRLINPILLNDQNVTLDKGPTLRIFTFESS